MENRNYPEIFFKLELVNRKYLLELTDYYGKRFDILKRREINRQSNKLLNYQFPIVEEEIELIKKMADFGKTIEELESFFQRSRKSIKSILDKNSIHIKNNLEDNSKHSISDDIVDCILNILIQLKNNEFSTLTYVLSKYSNEYKLKNIIDNSKYYLPFQALEKIYKLNTSLTAGNIQNFLTISMDKKEKQIEFAKKYKHDFEAFKSYLSSINLNEVYHFTDEKNLDSILMSGLISKEKLDESNIPYKSTHEGYKKINNFVSLSLTNNNPMMHIALRENRIKKPIIIRINSEVLYLKDTRFYNTYSNTLNSESGSSFDFFRSSIIHKDVDAYSHLDIRKQEILVYGEIDKQYIEGYY